MSVSSSNGNNSAAKGQWEERKRKGRDRKKSRFHSRSEGVASQLQKNLERRTKETQSDSKTNAERKAKQGQQPETDGDIYVQMQSLSKGEQGALKQDLQRVDNMIRKLISNLTGKDGVNRQAVSKALDAISDMAGSL